MKVTLKIKKKMDQLQKKKIQRQKLKKVTSMYGLYLWLGYF